MAERPLEPDLELPSPGHLPLERGLRTAIQTPTLLQPRDVRIVEDVWRYKFLNTDQLLRLHWPGRSEQVVRRRLCRLFEHGYLERLRPRAAMGQGTYQWTYFLGREGHELLRAMGHLPRRPPWHPNPVFSFAYVLHDIELNDWAIAYQSMLGDCLTKWRGEAEGSVNVPREAREFCRSYSGTPGLGDAWIVQDLDKHWVHPIRPDAVLDIELGSSGGRAQLFVEFDRTGRPDKVDPKLRRYDGFLAWWWRLCPTVLPGGLPVVVFVCPDEHSMQRLIDHADHVLRAHHSFWQAPPEREVFSARNRIIFCAEAWIHAGRIDALRVPEFPPGHGARMSSDPRKTRLPSHRP